MISMLRSRAVWYVAIYGPLLVILYFTSYRWLVGHDWSKGDYSYCYLVPLVVLYLVWEKRERWSREPSVPSWAGLLALLPGIFLFWIGELAGEFFSTYLSSWLVVAGLLWTRAGWKKLKIMVLPLFVSLFLFPLPDFINTKLTFNLRLLSSAIGVRIIQVLGMSAYREGNVIDLGFTQLQIVDACSGLRYLFPLLLMGILMAYFYHAALWKRVVMALSTIPISIGTNSLRIVLAAVLYPSMGPAAAEGLFHDFSGWAIFMICFAALLAEIWVLGKIVPRPDESFMKKKSGGDGDHDEKPAYPGTEGVAAGASDAGGSFMQAQFIVSVALLASTLAFYSMLDFREKPPAGQPFSTFPLAIGDWKGERQPLDQKFIDALEFTDYVFVNYSKDQNLPINFYVAYYASQQKGESIHSPETCLPGSGWIFRQAGKTTVSLQSGKSMTVNRAIMEKGGSRQLVYFWFPARGRILTNAYELKLFGFWDAMTRQRTDGALVRVITPVASSEGIEDTDRRLQSFIGEIMPQLNEFIPG